MLIESKKIGIIGCGNMSRAILHGLLSKIPVGNLTVSDASESQLAAIHDPPVSKPGLSHRLRKLIEIAKGEI